MLKQKLLLMYIEYIFFLNIIGIYKSMGQILARNLPTDFTLCFDFSSDFKYNSDLVILKFYANI